MRIIDGLTYTTENRFVHPDSGDSLFRGYYWYMSGFCRCVRYPTENSCDGARTCRMMIKALGLDRLHVALVIHLSAPGGRNHSWPSAKLLEVQDCEDITILPFDPLAAVFAHYSQYRIRLDQISMINPKVIRMTRKILEDEGGGLDLVVLSLFAVPFWYMSAEDIKSVGQQVVCDLKQVFLASEAPNLKNAAVPAEFS